MKKYIIITLSLFGYASIIKAQSGSPDNSFNSTGSIDFVFGTSYNYGTSCAIQPDGKIIAAGALQNGSTQFDTGVLRFNTDGTSDNTFGNNGQTIINISANDRANSVALQADGKIIAAGNNSDDFCVTRLDASGNLDATFNTTGKLVLDFGAGDECLKTFIQTDGKIILIGRGVISFANKICVARLNTDGSLDNTFDTDGMATYTVSGVADLGLSGAVQPDGKIIITGYSTLSPSGHDYTAIRINADGSVDNTFGNNGKVRVAIGSGSANDYTYDMALYPDGRIIMVGNNGLVRLNNNGTLDATFDGDGVLPFSADVRSVVLQADGKIVCGAYSTVYRFNNNGTVDNAFGSGGTTNFFTSYNNAYLSDVQLQSDGKIVIVSHNDLISGPSSPNFFIARFNGDATTGLDNLERNTSFAMFPNPCSDRLFIDLTKEKTTLINITDITGSIVYSKTHSETHKIEIETSFLNSGLYFLSIQGSTKKFVVQK